MDGTARRNRDGKMQKVEKVKAGKGQKGEGERVGVMKIEGVKRERWREKLRRGKGREMKGGRRRERKEEEEEEGGSVVCLLSL